ncbi:MAG: hypothetical protein Q4A12_07435 [Eubacteriales bacterium]|nr:hypothetical protein [Eubacteriales bacterium]
MKRLLIITIVSFIMFGILTACGAQTYNVDYSGQKVCYQNAQDSYEANEKVTLYFPMIATDTDYTFTLDGESLNYDYDDSKGFIIEFIMPEHDVTLECITTNSMEYYAE